MARKVADLGLVRRGPPPSDLSRLATAKLELDDEVTGRSPRTAWSLYPQVARELAQHAGHADILRKQILAQQCR